MELSMNKNDLFEYVRTQANTFFPDKHNVWESDAKIAMDTAIQRMENCFKYISFPAYSNDKGQTFFSHLHADQYATFLYFFSNSLWKLSENKVICDKLLYLNRTLNSLFISYKCGMPDVFFLGHPVGSIIGNAKYNVFLVVFQNVTINTGGGGTLSNQVPLIGKGVFLGAGSKIIGDKTVGNRVSIGVDAVVYN